MTTKFPDYTRVIPGGSGYKWLKITGELVTAVKDSIKYAPSDSYKVIIKTEGNLVTVTTGTESSQFKSEFEQEEVYANIEYAFSYKLLTEVLDIFLDSDICSVQEIVEGSQGKAPVIFENETGRALLMPLRIARRQSVRERS
jgi:DNA polymerase III sliding clamp (beta) subunit (PCNA family)